MLSVRRTAVRQKRYSIIAAVCQLSVTVWLLQLRFDDVRARNPYWQRSCNGLSKANTAHSQLGLMAMCVADTRRAPLGLESPMKFALKASYPPAIWCCDTGNRGDNTRRKRCVLPELQLHTYPAIMPSVRANGCSKRVGFTSSLLKIHGWLFSFLNFLLQLIDKYQPIPNTQCRCLKMPLLSQVCINAYAKLELLQSISDLNTCRATQMDRTLPDPWCSTLTVTKFLVRLNVSHEWWKSSLWGRQVK